MGFDRPIHFVVGGAGSDGVIDVAGPSGGPGLVSGPLHQFEFRRLAVTTSIVQS